MSPEKRQINVESASKWMSGEYSEPFPFLSENDDLKFFFHNSPVGSFGYGLVSIRVEIDKNTQLVEVPMLSPEGNPRDCAMLKTRYDLSKTLFISTLNAMGYNIQKTSRIGQC
jgi:hypothetical protein